MFSKLLNKILFVLIALLCVNSFLFAQKTHPYLFYTPQKIQQTKERIRNDTLMSRVWYEMKTSADKAIEAGRAGNMEELSLAYRMTGDKKYAEAAKKGLLQLLSKPAWDGMDDRTPRWNSGLATARGNFTSAIVFDAIHDYLS